jgi:hypothetical protein
LYWIVFGDAGPRWTSQSDEDRGITKVTWVGDIENGLKAWDDAEQQLIAFLCNKELTARGRRNGVGEPADIPEDFWRGGTLRLVALPEPAPGPKPQGNYALHEFDPSRGEWYDITLDFADIQQLFPAVSLVNSKPASPADVELWYRAYVQSGERISQRAEKKAAELHFGRTIRRARLREIRLRVLKDLRPERFDRKQPGRLASGRRPP